jgi:uncharacterized protein (TIGR00299 family) protein
MTAAHIVAEEGVAGDMLLGALVDAGAPLAELAAPVAALGAGCELGARTVSVRGVAATKVDVLVPEGAPRTPTLADARSLLASAGLAEAVAGPAERVLAALAGAEAQAHGITPEQVVFHELGDADTVADVVGVCAGLAALGVERLTCGPVAVGAGAAGTDHGPLPVPPPAVTALLRGFVIGGGLGEGPRRELTTPTGAALLAALAEPVDGVPLLRLGSSGRGGGDLRRASPSLVTLLVGRAAGEADGAAPAAEGWPAVVLEATVDDLSGEHVPVVLDRLREGGAHDAWAVPATMKKGRPGHTLTALANEVDLPALAATLLREAGTLGVRWHRVTKHPLARRWVEVDVAGQPVRVKVGELNGQAVAVAPEHDDVAAAAAALGRPVREVAADAAVQGRGRLAAG